MNNKYRGAVLRVQRLVRVVDAVSLQQKFAGGIAALLVASAGIGWWVSSHTIAVFEPRGQIASKERSLIFVALLLSLIVVLPVFALTIGIVLKYRETNPKTKKYDPDWDRSWRLESIWWGFPLAIILFLSVITWQSSHELDPFKEIASKTPALHVQVVSLDWKWLFIYPEQHIATVNYVPLPVDTPIDFQLTSGSVMNSFWIPQLGGQVYTMTGMSTQLHLLANKTGDYVGSSANISGKGFADMHFKARVTDQADFQNWVQQAQYSQPLDNPQLSKLLKPAVAKQTATYGAVPSGVYDSIMMPFMAPQTSHAPMGMMQ